MSNYNANLNLRGFTTLLMHQRTTCINCGKRFYLHDTDKMGAHCPACGYHFVPGPGGRDVDTPCFEMLCEAGHLYYVAAGDLWNRCPLCNGQAVSTRDLSRWPFLHNPRYKALRESFCVYLRSVNDNTYINADTVIRDTAQMPGYSEGMKKHTLQKRRAVLKAAFILSGFCRFSLKSSAWKRGVTRPLQECSQ